MSYAANIEGFEDQKIVVDVSFWSGPKLLINGQPAPKGSKRGEMLLQRNDGTQAIASWRQQFLGLDVPQLVVDGKVVKLVDPLRWYQYVWGGLPILLIFGGGALGAIAGLIGAIAGLIGFSVNIRVFRTGPNSAMRYVVSGAVSALAVAVYFVVAILFTLLINNR